MLQAQGSGQGQLSFVVFFPRFSRRGLGTRKPRAVHLAKQATETFKRAITHDSERAFRLTILVNNPNNQARKNPNLKTKQNRLYARPKGLWYTDYTV